MIQRQFKLALTAGRTIPLVIPANQYDSGEQWLFTLYDEHGTKFIPTTGAIVGIKSDSHAIINTGTVDSAGRVVITETTQMTAAVGKNIYELLIEDQMHGTANFIVMVEPRPGDDAEFSDSDLSLLEEAIQGTSETAIIAGVQDWMDDNLTSPTNPIVDASLSLSGAAADAKKTGDEISDLKSAIASGGGGLTADVKQALMNCFNYVAWKGNDPNASQYINALQSALYPPASLVSISAVYTQSGVVKDTDSLASLRADLVVTAHYADDTSGIVNGYTLSGTLVEGTSIITVTYGGKTTTFNVTVSSDRVLLYSWDLTDSLTDTVSGKVATVNNATITADGLSFASTTSALLLSDVYGYNRRYEIDIASTNASMSSNGGTKGSVYGFGNGQIFKLGNETLSAAATSSIVWQFGWRGANDAFYTYVNGGWKTNYSSYIDSPNYFSGKTLWIESDSEGHITFGADDVSIGVDTSYTHTTGNNLLIGQATGNGQAFKNMVISAIRVYEAGE